jgi:peroxiredoxin
VATGVVITDRVNDVDIDVVGEQVLVAPAVLPDALGWELKPEGLCRGDVCVPVRDRAALDVDGRVDLGAVASALGRPVLVDAARRVVAIGLPRAEQQPLAAGAPAAPFSLPDLDGHVHELGEWSGTKRLVVTFASWCGCRYDLPGWQALRDELAGEGHQLNVIAVALDESADAVNEFAEKVDLPVLLDREHLLSELYAVSNVPTVVWIDEDDRIARPNRVAFGDDQFEAFHGVPSAPHHDAVRAWVRDGVLPTEPEHAGVVAQLDDDEVLARLHFRIATQLRRAGDEEGATEHFDSALALAPLDFTIARAQMPLRGGDPFGAEFFELYEQWQVAGSPVHALPPMREPGQR